MKKQERLAKKTAVRLTREVELQLKRGQIHVELLDDEAAVNEFLKQADK